MVQISENILEKWQHVVNFVAKIVDVPACLVMQANAPKHTVFVASSNESNPYYVGQTFELSPNLYCERVISTRSELIVPDALRDPEWSQNDDIEFGMTFYIGRPLLWPDGRLFGTICLLDQRRNQKALLNREIIERFQEVVEADLALMDEVSRREEVQSKLTSVLCELERNTADLVVADQRKNELLAMLAHELRNPLAPLRSAAQLLKTPQDGAQPPAEIADLIERQVGQLARIIDGLLDVNTIVQDRLTLALETIALSDVVRLAVETSEPRIQKRGQTLSVTLPDKPVFLNADRTRLSQIIGNLLHNASKYTQSGGHISLTVEARGREAVFRIKDDGIGMAPEHLDSIFDLFMQIDNAPGRTTGGTGMGLTLVRRLVALHKGTVEAHSQGLGTGSEFVVRLPICTSAPRKIAPRSPAMTTVKRLLVVDDNIDAADTLALLLRHLGIRVETAYDGPSAIDTTRSFAPEVILLDLGMPVMDGFTTCNEIRKLPGGADIIILALTGWSQADVADKVSTGGFDGHLVKPVRHADIIEFINNAVRTRSTPTALLATSDA